MSRESAHSEEHKKTTVRDNDDSNNKQCKRGRHHPAHDAALGTSKELHATAANSDNNSSQRSRAQSDGKAPTTQPRHQQSNEQQGG